MVKKLGLNLIPHPRPYRLLWLNNYDEIKGNKQAFVPFIRGRYTCEALCDIVPMHACHVLLGRPWQFDRKAHHDGFLNSYSFMEEGRKVTLAPLSPNEVYDDQSRLEKERVDIENAKRVIEPPKNGKDSGNQASVQPKLKKGSLLAKEGEIRHVVHTDRVLFSVTYMDLYLNTANLDLPLSSMSANLLQEFDDVFPKEMSTGLPPERGIDHQIDFVLRAAIPK
ncbi:uncharacterized protein LOC125369529 [Ricinus communis]|uniref:uncharacterized protein LOC125369529 n=1 Tax=Ricinus communis TaxID=3988 RepID=UPI00201A83B3|nr:uncharacterized protein LOC125369529 [Ricinus communis]